ncbi:MAG: diaminopimelate epimerase [Chloroflexi bacterium]|nr:diaminopimelate epimerase [Chloroflexota bacterium]
MLFTKMEGTGNDFVIVESQGEELPWARLAVTLCDRHHGIGADGILVAMPSKTAEAKMRMFNPDGSEAEMCGNGIRCFAKYVLTSAPAGNRRDSLSIETKAGIKKVRATYDGDRITGVRVDMGKPIFSPARIPVAIKDLKSGERYSPPVLDFPLTLGRRKFPLSLVSMGNPHAICFLKEKVDAFGLSEIGPRIETHEMFPKRTNFEVANVVSQKKVRARVWERGAGATLSCGTGACAVAVASILHGFTDTTVEIELPGGSLEIEWNGKDEVFLKGPANFVFKGEWIERN